MSKVEKETIINYKFESKMKDVGTFEIPRLKLRRRSPRLDAGLVTTKSALTGGLPPITRGEQVLIDAIATLTVYMEPVNEKGESDPKISSNWVDDILDQDIVFDLFNKWMDYQNSFYVTEDKNAPPAQA